MNKVFETVYVSLESIELISNKLNEPKWMLERRLAAYENFKELNIDQDNLFYKYTNFKNFKMSDLKPYWETEEVLAINPDNKIIGEIESTIIETPNMINIMNNKLNLTGAKFTTIHNIISENEELAKKIIKEADVSARFDKLGELSKALASNIIVLYVPKNTKIDEPQLRQVLFGSDSVAYFSEFIIYLEESSEITYFEFYRNLSKHNTQQLFLMSQTVILKDNARLLGLQVQDWNPDVLHIGSKLSSIHSYANLNILHHFQGGLLTRFNSGIKLIGKGGEAYDLFNTFGNSTQRFDIKSELSHLQADTIGQTHSRTVMMDKSESVLRGLIHISETGTNADSYLTSNGLTVGNGKVVAVPALKIDQNDVVAGHAASVEPLSKDKIFYIQSRGIDKYEAEALLVKGYFEPIIKLIKNEKLQELVRMKISEKWEKVS
jgi:Fe-S cluster assembly protein SufD